MMKVSFPKTNGSGHSLDTVKLSERDHRQSHGHLHSHGHFSASPGDLAECDHFVQFYEDDTFLVSSVAAFIGAGLGAGEGAIVIATPEHREALGAQLLKQGLDLQVVQVRGQYVALDAAETLSRFMVNGMPDEALFNASVGKVVQEMNASRGNLRAFGEMVALLWAAGNGAAAIRLEELWNDLGQKQSFTLFCAYPMSGFQSAKDHKAFERICETHSRVLPSESYSHARPESRSQMIASLQQKALSLETEIAERRCLEETLRRRTEELSIFFETAAIGLHWVGQDGTILWANAAEMEMLGYTREEYIGHNIKEFHACRETIENILACLNRGEKLRDFEAELRCQDGSLKTVLIDSSVLWDENGGFVHTQCFTRDITEKKRAEHALRKKEAQLQLITDSTPVMFAQCSRDQRFGYVNRAYAERFDLTPDQIVGKALPEILGREAYQKIEPYIKTVLAGQPVVFEIDIPYKKIGCRIMYVSYSPEKDEHGHVTGWIASIYDITEKKRAEEQLRESEARLRQLMSLMPAAVYTCDEAGRITYFNRRAAELWGSEPDLNGHHQRFCGAFRLWNPDGSPMPHEETPMAAAVETGKSTRNGEVIIERPNGSRVTVSVNIDPLFRDGKRCGAINVFQDITERKETENAARRLAAIVESSSDAVISKDLTSTITSWNNAAEQIFGYTAEEMVGKSILLLIPSDRHGEEASILERIRRGERIDPFETIRRRKDGKDLVVSLSISPIKDTRGKIIGASKIARDITQRKQMEREQHALYELVAGINRAESTARVYDAALEAICCCHKADRASILLYDDDNVMRFKAWRGLSEEYRRAVEGHSPWQPNDPNPQPVCINDVADVLLDPHLHEVIEREGIRSLAFIPIVSEHRLLGKFMIYYNQPHHFTREEIRPAETIAIQIAFAIERRRSQRALERLIDERTASLREAIAQMEEFSYSVSHDLRAPVRAMQGYAKVLLEDYSDRLDTAGREYLERIIRGGSRMDRMTQDLLSYSRLTRREVQVNPVSLDKLLREIIQQYPEMHLFSAHIQIHGPLPEIMGHEPSLAQAVSNLLSNAVKFVAPGITPEIQIWAEPHEGAVRLWISDNGIGIKPEYQRRLFGMFERIHPEKNYEGTGIGLAIVRRAVERMGGHVGVESDGVHGSKFWIQLPAASAT